jgi:hypothetical protein
MMAGNARFSWHGQQPEVNRDIITYCYDMVVETALQLESFDAEVKQFERRSRAE